MISNKRIFRGGFTLVELLVVIGMIAVIMGAITTSVSAAQERARISRATVEVKAVTQAILASENFSSSDNYELKTMTKADCDSSSLSFLLGKGGETKGGGKMPVLLMAALTSGGKMLDPWGTPYKVTVKPGSASVKIASASGSMQTGYYLPNFLRLTEEERK